ncbi:radial spoke head 1 homolog [Cyclospora cayetanensis]|uniref:Radial spoke head 1 homolog n=1 Tax=Cyclospora cayetanensis TaxID=88456 RepID=A0A6P6RWA0_9EIME|nr:radial spoke head 1 homolog [Cyclospora cayetanensis]
MNNESDEAASPKFEIITVKGRGSSSRGHTGSGIATYLIDEKGRTERFSGQYVSGIRQGAGEYRFADGSQFKGKYENNKKHGLGEALYKNGRDTGEGEAGTSGDARYIGHFVGGQRQPYGTLIYSNGDVYEGEWFAGQKHGEGSYRFCSDGSILSGSWEAGWLKKGRWILPTGAVYIGEFVLNKPNGRGAWLIPSGNQTKKTSDQTGNEEGSADEEGIAKYEIAKIDVQYICTVTTRE